MLPGQEAAENAHGQASESLDDSLDAIISEAKEARSGTRPPFVARELGQIPRDHRDFEPSSPWSLDIEEVPPVVAAPIPEPEDVLSPKVAAALAEMPTGSGLHPMPAQEAKPDATAPVPKPAEAEPALRPESKADSRDDKTVITVAPTWMDEAPAGPAPVEARRSSDTTDPEVALPAAELVIGSEPPKPSLPPPGGTKGGGLPPLPMAGSLFAPAAASAGASTLTLPPPISVLAPDAKTIPSLLLPPAAGGPAPGRSLKRLALPVGVGAAAVLGLSVWLMGPGGGETKPHPTAATVRPAVERVPPAAPAKKMAASSRPHITPLPTTPVPQTESPPVAAARPAVKAAPQKRAARAPLKKPAPRKSGPKGWVDPFEK